MSVKKLNQNPLERLCRQLLKEKQQEVTPDHLYSLQLAQWFLENYDLEGPWAVQQEDLLEQVKMLYVGNPVWVQKQLLGDLTVWNLEEKNKSPRRVGAILVEDLYDSLPYHTPKL